MPALPEALAEIARSRKRDALAPVTVIVPSHVAAIELRRRLAAATGRFAAVRFETLPRLAELLAGGALAREGRSPLARPIGDYLAGQVALEAGAQLAAVRDLPGFARVLRDAFRRLRRGGFRRAEEIPIALGSGLLGEVVRLYGLFRQRCSRFYDDEDLLDAAALAASRGGSGFAAELGDIYVLPPGALTAGADRLLAALRRAAGPSRFRLLDETVAQPSHSFVLAPDPITEAREAVREVITALESGCGLHEVAVFYGADPSYRGLLALAFENAGVPCAAMPGRPLSETRAGRAVLTLAELPLADYSRTAVIDWLSLAPLRAEIPSDGGRAFAVPAAWRRLAREAGITKGGARWQSGLQTLVRDREQELGREDLSDERREVIAREVATARDLAAAIAALVARLEPLRSPQPAKSFIAAFKGALDAYLEPGAPGLDAVLRQVDQLGTVDAVEGSFSLQSFVAALRANLDAAYLREGDLGSGILVADYRLAAGLSFKRAVLCGAYEGVFPAGAPHEPLVADAYWAQLRAKGRPFLEDAALRQQRSRAAAERVLAVAAESLTWTAPLQAANAGREHYPSQLMLNAARTRDAALRSASDLRRAAARDWLRRPPSPLAAVLARPFVDASEVRLQAAVLHRSRGRDPGPESPLYRPLLLLRARHGPRFSEYDGNLSALAGDALVPRGSVSPTSLELYAACGLRYFLNGILRLRPPEEPEDRDTFDPRDRGSLVHEVLEEFYRRQLEDGRPRPGEPWTANDRDLLLSMFEGRLEAWTSRGRAGLDVFAEHQRRRLRSDLVAFLDADSVFRAETGAVPVGLELRIPETQIAGLSLRGFVDRIDRTPDGRRAWVIDYKTGRADGYEKVGSDDDPLVGGTKLQLPVYLAAAADAEDVRALYWFVSAEGNFRQIEFPAVEPKLERFRATLAAVLDAVRAGIFPAVPGDEGPAGFANCRYCDFDRLCSRRRDDEFVRKQEDPSLRPWFRVGEAALGVEA